MEWATPPITLPLPHPRLPVDYLPKGPKLASLASASGEGADLLPEEWLKGSCAGCWKSLEFQAKVYRCALKTP